MEIVVSAVIAIAIILVALFVVFPWLDRTWLGSYVLTGFFAIQGVRFLWRGVNGSLLWLLAGLVVGACACIRIGEHRDGRLPERQRA